jgi:hypothetical protein
MHALPSTSLRHPIHIPADASPTHPLATLVLPLRLFALPVSDLPGLGLYRVDC